MSGAVKGGAGATGVIAGVWTVIERVTIAAAVQTFDFTSVLADARYIGYRVTARLVNDQAGTSSYGLRLNGAAAAVNRQKLTADAGVTVFARDTNNIVAVLPTSAGAGKFCDLGMICRFPNKDDVSERFFCCDSTKAIADTDNPDVFFSTLHLTTPAVTVAITSIGVGCDTASGIGIGSVLELEAMGAL